jgi:hypothetical protein
MEGRSREVGDMTEIKSETITIQRKAEDIYNFLIDFNNFGKLMPEQIIHWQSTTDECSFTIKGMADISLAMADKMPFTYIKYISGNKSPFAFSINNYLTALDSSSSDVMIMLHADLSPMLKMMAERPLKNFVNLLVNKLKEIMDLPGK